MTVDPFIEAEEARRSQREERLSPARGLPSAYYERRTAPRRRASSPTPS